jgi:hypothetical protein
MSEAVIPTRAYLVKDMNTGCAHEWSRWSKRVNDGSNWWRSRACAQCTTVQQQMHLTLNAGYELGRGRG